MRLDCILYLYLPIYCSAQILPKCKLYEDIEGQWINTPKSTSTTTINSGIKGDNYMKVRKGFLKYRCDTLI